MKHCLLIALLALLSACTAIHGQNRTAVHRPAFFLPSGQDICYLKHDHNISGGYVLPYSPQPVHIVIGNRPKQ